MALLLATPKGALLLIEEPESFLHPQATTDLFHLMEKVCADQDKQIIMTTHSPLLMELAGPRLNVVIRDETSGVSSVVRPSEGAQKALARRGLLKSFMLVPFEPGFNPAGLLIVEGPDDREVWDAWLARAGLADKGVVATTGGDGESAATELALYIRQLQDTGMRSAPFLLVVDSDGDVERKKEGLRTKGLLDQDFHVLKKKEIEDYLLDPAALGSTLDVAPDLVAGLVKNARRGKEGLNSVVAAIGEEKSLRTLTSADTTLKGQIASRVEPYEDLLDVIGFFQEKLA